MKERLELKVTSELEQPFTFSSPNLEGKRNGFTLIELIIVIAVIGVMASIAIPAFLRARVQSNETATIANLRTLSSAAEAFRASSSPPAYAPDLTAMITSNPPYLDAAWSANLRQGYNYTYTTSGDGGTYSIQAAPQIVNVSGVRIFCVDQTGVIRAYTSGGNVGGAVGCDSSGTPI